jgi:hypothetical protein
MNETRVFLLFLLFNYHERTRRLKRIGRTVWLTSYIFSVYVQHEIHARGEERERVRVVKVPSRIGFVEVRLCRSVGSRFELCSNIEIVSVQTVRTVVSSRRGTVE